MERIELYKDLKQGTLDEDRNKLLLAIDRLVQEADLLKGQIDSGHIFNANLADRGRQVDELAISVQQTMGTIALLDSIQNDEA